MNLLIFILFTIFFVWGSIGVFKFLLIATQRGQFLGKWQDVLEWLYGKGFKNAEKLLGGCGMCFAHFMSILMFCIYVAVLAAEGMWIWNWWQSVCWYFVFVGASFMGMLRHIPKNNDSPKINQPPNVL